MREALKILCRVVLGAAFVFSGFVKAVDPWGTAIKLGEYFDAFGLGWFEGAKYALSIALSGGEMLLGVLILAGLWRRLASTAVLAVMTFFTLLTLALAIWSPVEDCGCFGDALKLSNWGTFVKNLILWPMAWVVWLSWRHEAWLSGARDWALAAVFGAAAMGIGVYANAHLPLIDFLPYNVGVDLAAEYFKPEPEVESATVVVRDLQTGRRRRFDIGDSTWYDATRFEFLKISGGGKAHVSATVRDFALIDAEGNVVTDSILRHRGEVFMAFVERADMVRGRCGERLEKAMAAARERGAWVMVVTPQSLAEFGSVMSSALRLNLDATTFKTVLRAHVGVVVLRNGKITDKRNCRDL